MKVNQFNNIRVEMTKAQLSVSDLAGEMKMTPQALYHKLNGRTEFTLSQMQLLKSILVKYTGNNNLTFEQLFGERNDC